MNFLVAGNTPSDLLKEVPIRPKNVFGEPISLEELDECDLDDEIELGIGGEEVVRFRATDEGNQFVRKMIDPKLPSQKDVEEHNLTHLPYRNWCPICVRSKGKEMGHKSATDKERTISEYCLDYCFPGDEFGYK